MLEKIVKSKLKFYVVSKSKQNVLRGLHFQRKNPQEKFLSVLKGEIFDVALDLGLTLKLLVKALQDSFK